MVKQQSPAGGPKRRKSIPDALRKALYVDAGFQCSVARCGVTFPSIDVHHIDGDRSNASPDNLVVLCKNHHGQATVGQLTVEYCLAIKERLKSLRLAEGGTAATDFLKQLTFSERGSETAPLEGRRLEARDLWCLKEPASVGRCYSDLCRQKLIAIVDRPGTGKTTFALMIARRASAEGAHVLSFRSDLYSTIVDRRLHLFHAGMAVFARTPGLKVLIVDDAHVVFRGLGGRLALESLLTYLSTRQDALAILAYTTSPTDRATERQSTRIAVPDIAYRVANGVPQNEIRQAAYEYLRERRPSTEVEVYLAAAQSHDLTVWQFVHLASGQSPLVPQTSLIWTSAIARILLFEISKATYLENKSLTSRAIIEGLPDGHWTNALDLIDVDQRVVRDQLRNLVWGDRLVAYDAGVVRGLHYNHAQQLLSELTRFGDSLAIAMRQTLLVDVESAVSKRGLAEAKSMLGKIRRGDKRAVRLAARAIQHGATADLSASRQMSGLERYGARLRHVSNAIEITGPCAEADALAQRVIAPFNVLIRRTGNTLALYHLSLELFELSPSPVMHADLARFVDNEHLARLVSRPKSPGDVMDIVIVLDAIAGMKRLRAVEMTLLSVAEIQRVAEVALARGQNARRGTEPASLIAAAMQHVERVHALLAVGRTVAGGSLTTHSGSPPDIRSEVERLRNDVQTSLTATNEESVRLRQEALDELDRAEMCLTLDVAASSTARLAREAFPELNLTGSPMTVVRNLAASQLSPLSHISRLPAGMARVMSALDVMELQKRVKRWPPTWGALLLRALFTADARVALDMLRSMTAEQRAELREAVLKTLRKAAYSPLHIEPHSLASLQFAWFVAHDDPQLMSSLLKWFTKELKKHPSKVRRSAIALGWDRFWQVVLAPLTLTGSDTSKHDELFGPITRS